MSLILLHISDIHIKSKSDAILEHANEIAKTTYGDLAEAQTVVVVVSGDIAYSGKKEEYENARIFLEELKQSIVSQTDAALYFIIAPGNHDCDFSKNSNIRKILIDTLEREHNTTVDYDFIKSCTEIQNNFFEFRTQFEPTSSTGDELWKTFEVTIEEKKIIFEILNISWTSKLKEEPGKLFFPIENYIAEKSKVSADIRILVMHHPLNWFSQSIYRKFRTEVRNLADIIITGHEHEGNIGVISEAESANSAFVEGCVLQEKSDTMKGSSFNIIKIDIKNSQFLATKYIWSGDRYEPEDYGDWSSYLLLPTKKNSPFIISDEFQERLDDPGAFLRHSSGVDIKLSDIFIYPDVRKISQTADTKSVFTNSSKFRSLTDSEPGIIIQGDEKSGRTSLIYQLYLEYHQRGVVPVLINGKDIRTNPNVDLLIKSAITKQYGDKAWPHFIQLEKSRKMLFIDDFDESNIKSNNVRSEILKSFSDRFSTLIVAVGGLFDLKELIEGDSANFLAGFEHYNLQQFGYVLRSKLIKKWFSLGADGTISRQDWLARIDQAERTINTVMEKLVIPSLPLYLLTLLQSMDAGKSANLKESALGHYYHYLLTESFTASGVPADKLNENFQYACHLAWEFHSSGKKLLNELELREFNTRYSDRWHSTDFSQKLKILTSSRVISKTGDEYGFRYPYIYFYLKGLYLSENLQDLEIRSHIEHWCKHLYVRDYANTILFLAHHTNNEFLLNAITNSLNSLFSDRSPITFESDANAIKSIIERAHELKYIGGSPDDHRERNNHMKDQVLSHEDGLMQKEELDGSLSLVAKMTMLFKTTEILGQILKDQYSKIERFRKKQIIEELFCGPLRAITDFYEFVGRNPEALITEIEEMIKRKNIGSDSSQSKLIAQRVGAQIVQLITCGFLMKAANSSNSESLLEDVREVALKGKTSFKLIELAILLDSPKSIPRQKLEDLYLDQKKDLIVGQVIKMMVLRRLYMFYTSEADMQWLHNNLDLDINKQHSISYGERGRKFLR